MKDEWAFFADVQQRLATGQQLVQGFCAEPLAFPFDEMRGTVVDERGTEYELGSAYKQALSQCVQQTQTAWGLCFRERLICFGPAVASGQYPTDYLVGFAASTEVLAR